MINPKQLIVSEHSEHTYLHVRPSLVHYICLVGYRERSSQLGEVCRH